MHLQPTLPGGGKCRHITAKDKYNPWPWAHTRDEYLCCDDYHWCGDHWQELQRHPLAGDVHIQKLCCPTGTYCASSSPPWPLCCPVGRAACGSAPAVFCCGDGEYCTGGRFCCKKDQEECGPNCCSPGAHCFNPVQGTCCPAAGADVCYDKCCNATHPACDRDTGMCCQAKGFKACGTSLCCPADKICLDPTTNPR